MSNPKSIPPLSQSHASPAAPAASGKPGGGLISFRKDYSRNAINLFFGVVVVLQIIYFKHFLPILWMAFATVTVLLFFNNLSKLSKSWTRFSNAAFRRKLFQQALIIRVIYVIFFYIFIEIMTGGPFEYSAGDAIVYNSCGIILSDHILVGDFNFFRILNGLDISDMGYPIVLGFFYALCFKSILIARIFNALISAWTCVLVYDLAKRNFNERVARLAGIMMLLMPNFIYYCGLTLKESIMVFFVVASVNLADKLLRSRTLNFSNLIFLIITAGALFWFRTVLALSVITSIGISIVVISERVSKSGRRAFLGFWFVICVLIIFNSSIGETIDKLIREKAANQISQMTLFSERKNGNTLAKYGTKSIFLPMILIAPFPTFVDTSQPNAEMLSGAVFTRNVYAFFVLVALGNLYKRKLLRTHALIIAPLTLYLLIVGSSGFALSERFHLPALPFLVILASYGITQMTRKNTKYYLPYLLFVSLVIIGWNWFKLTGRGIVD